ncbi:MAG: hypothetical protein IPJ71_19090 [Bdellovibrionales bacterium]|nr:hypothetical protein [Bdellovibrionales bacterium]
MDLTVLMDPETVFAEVEVGIFCQRFALLTLHLGGMAGGKDPSSVFTDMVIYGEKIVLLQRLFALFREVRVGYRRTLLKSGKVRPELFTDRCFRASRAIETKRNRRC